MSSISRFRESVTIQRPKADLQKDTFGHVDLADASNWDDVLTVWADVLISGSREFTKLGITRAEVTHAIRIRHSTAALPITSVCRVKRQDGSLLNIAGDPFDPKNDRCELVIPAIG